MIHTPNELKHKKQIEELKNQYRKLKEENEQLKFDNQRLNLAFETASEGIWDWDLRTEKVYLSPHYFTMLGYQPNELPQSFDTWIDLLHPDDKEVSINTVKNAIENGDNEFMLNFRLRTKQDDYKWILGKGKAIERNETGKPVRYIGVHIDIHEQKTIEELLREEEAKLQGILKTIPVGIAIIANRIIRSANNRMEEMLGIRHGDLLGFKESSLFHSLSEYQRVSTIRKQHLDNNNISTVETVWTTNKGKNIDVMLRFSPIDLQNPDDGILVAALDITEKKQVEQILRDSQLELKMQNEEYEALNEELRQSYDRIQRINERLKTREEQYKKLIENSPNAIIVIDGTVIVFINTAAVHTLGGNDASQFINHSIAAFIHPDLLAQINKDIDRNQQTHEFSINRVDGKSIDIEAFIADIEFRDKEARQIIFRDITLRKKTQQQLIEAKEKAEESDRLKTAFLANMSHEIRTPMNGITGFAELLKDPDLSFEKRIEYVQFIEESSKTLLTLITDIIDISKIHANMVNIIKNPCQINTLIDEMKYIYTDQLAQANKSNISIKTEKALPNEEAIIYADETRLRQIFDYLVGNAIKFTNDGVIEIGYSYNQDDSEIEFYVKDTGIGIPKEKQILIFQEFIQADSSSTRQYGGTGLGLSISKGLIELMGGKIRVESNENQGACLKFTIPYKPVEDMDIGESGWFDKQEEEYNWSDKKILVAEDEEINFMFVQAVLDETGANITRATNGYEAVEIFSQNPDIDLILMDIKMPEMNGYEATRKIKQQNGNVPIIAQTAYALSEDEGKAFDAGCDDYIAKPINQTILLSKVAKHIESK